MLTGQQIKQELNARGFNYVMIAEVLKVDPTLVSSTANRVATSAPAAHAICKALGKPISKVFSDKPEYAKRSPRLTGKEREQKKTELAKLLQA